MQGWGKESVITEEMNGKEASPGSGPAEIRKVEPLTEPLQVFREQQQQ